MKEGIAMYFRDGTTTGDFCIDLYDDMLPSVGQSVRWTDLRGETHFGRVRKRNDRSIEIELPNTPDGRKQHGVVSLIVERIIERRKQP